MIASVFSSSTLLYTLTPHRPPSAQSPPFRFRRVICSASSNSNSIKISADTSGSSPRPPPSIADRDNDIALRLPELKTLLDTLRSARQAAGGGLGGPGSVSLVGTGPGDPELLTLKAVKAIGGADLILYDRLVSNEVLGLVRPEARMLYVGKTAGYHSRTQEEIHELLHSFAEVGANVVRLKGGDPLRRRGDGFPTATRNSSQDYSRNYFCFWYSSRTWHSTYSPRSCKQGTRGKEEPILYTLESMLPILIQLWLSTWVWRHFLLLRQSW